MSLQSLTAPIDIPSLHGSTPTYRVVVMPTAPITGHHPAGERRVGQLYFLAGDLTRAEVETLCRELLADPVTETFTIEEVGEDAAFPADVHTVEVTLLPGVTDPAAETLLDAARLLGVTGLAQAATGRRYEISAQVPLGRLEALAHGAYANPVVQRYAINHPIPPPFIPPQPPDATVEVIPVRGLNGDALVRLSQSRRLALNGDEMWAIRAHYEAEGRDPTDAELETLAQTWSEHCVHKTFKALIDYTGPIPNPQSPISTFGQSPISNLQVDGILHTYIRAATERLDKPWVRSAFVDNAGIIAFDEGWDLAFKVETHNHPSALEPFGGANTGVGGVVRDILGVSARPIANTDVLCFGLPDTDPGRLPHGVLHPRRVRDGVVHGIEDYGNKMGIPTVNGAVHYHPGYTANPLVYCGCLGLLPTGRHPSAVQPGDLIVVVGGRTGRDGLRGATFSSMEMDQSTAEIAGSAVQIGHPIHEKAALEAVLRARDEGLYHAITDCGAGGLSSAVGEMGADLGALVHLERVPLKYPGLRPWEIWLSEAQERMALAVPETDWPRLQAICAGQDIEAVAIGVFEPTGRLRLRYGDRVVGDMDMRFLHDGLPRRRLTAVWTPPAALARPEPHHQDDDALLGGMLLALLRHPTVASKESIIRRYDHEVQGGTAVKPLVGAANAGPSDAAVLAPFDTVKREELRIKRDEIELPPSSLSLPHSPPRGVALSAGLCPQYGELDPYVMAWAAVDEALRNAVAVGADPDQVAILDNFCWGNPQLPDRLGALVRCAQGCYDAALAYGTPFISGKDSLNNEYTGADGQKHAIPGTLLISAVGIAPDIGRTVTMDLKALANRLYLVGATRAELAGSLYHLVSDRQGGQLPQPVPHALNHLRALHRAIVAGLVQACHDLSEGGLAVALAEMSIAGRLGADLDLAAVPVASGIDHADTLLFSESLTRFLVEVRPADAPAFEAALTGVPHAPVGLVTDTGALRVRGLTGAELFTLDIARLEAAWRGEDLHTDNTKVSPALSPLSFWEKDGVRVAVPTGAAKSLTPPHVDTQPAQGNHKGSPYPHSTPKRVLVLHARGANRDRVAARACELAGGQAEIVHVNQLLAGERRLADYTMLVLPGGFSYGDDLGAGTLWALDLRRRLDDQVRDFIASGRPVLGICNGFQALVKAGLLPSEADGPDRRVTLTFNESGHFECRWVYLQANPASPCLFTQGLETPIYCPVAHGEGRLMADDATLATLQARGSAALTYIGGAYPHNPSGARLDIAGLTNPAGNVLGLMPHPEDHVFGWQHPRWHRGEQGMSGLALFVNGLRQA